MKKINKVYKQILFQINFFLKAILIGFRNFIIKIVDSIILGIKEFGYLLKRTIIFIIKTIKNILLWIRVQLIKIYNFLIYMYLSIESFFINIVQGIINIFIALKWGTIIIPIYPIVYFFYGLYIFLITIIITFLMGYWAMSSMNKEEERIEFEQDIKSTQKLFSKPIKFIIRLCFLLIPTVYAIYSNIDYIKGFNIFSSNSQIDTNITLPNEKNLTITKAQSDKTFKKKFHKEINIKYKVNKLSSLEWDTRPYTEKENKSFIMNKTYKRILSWDEAKKYCDNLVYLDKKDWLLPSIDMLKKYYKNNMNDKTDKVFWSSTLFENDKEAIWTISSSGEEIAFSKYYKLYVRCVRRVSINKVTYETIINTKNNLSSKSNRYIKEIHHNKLTNKVKKRYYITMSSLLIMSLLLISLFFKFGSFHLFLAILWLSLLISYLSIISAFIIFGLYCIVIILRFWRKRRLHNEMNSLDDLLLGDVKT